MSAYIFPVYSGRKMQIGPETHAFLAEHFPEVDLASEYRSIDAWLWSHPKRLPTRRFLVSWMKRAKQFEIALKNRDAEKQEALRREVAVGGRK